MQLNNDPPPFDHFLPLCLLSEQRFLFLLGSHLNFEVACRLSIPGLLPSQNEFLLPPLGRTS